MIHNCRSIAALAGIQPNLLHYHLSRGHIPGPDLPCLRERLWSEERALTIVDFLRSRKGGSKVASSTMAAAIGVSHTTFYRWIREGKIPPPDLNTSGRPYYSRELADQIISNPPRAGERYWKGGASAVASDKGETVMNPSPEHEEMTEAELNAPLNIAEEFEAIHAALDRLVLLVDRRVAERVAEIEAEALKAAETLRPDRRLIPRSPQEPTP